MTFYKHENYLSFNSLVGENFKILGVIKNFNGENFEYTNKKTINGKLMHLKAYAESNVPFFAHYQTL